MLMKAWYCVVPLLLVVGGCYSHRVIDAPQPGMDVRARLNNEAAVRRSVGLDEPVLQLDGRVVEATPESIALDVLLARDVSQFRNIEIRDTLWIDRNELQSITVRELETTRSILFAGAVGVGAYFVVRGISSVVGGSEDDSDGGRPVFSLTLPMR